MPVTDWAKLHCAVCNMACKMQGQGSWQDRRRARSASSLGRQPQDTAGGAQRLQQDAGASDADVPEAALTNGREDGQPAGSRAARGHEARSVDQASGRPRLQLDGLGAPGEGTASSAAASSSPEKGAASVATPRPGDAGGAAAQPSSGGGVAGSKAGFGRPAQPGAGAQRWTAVTGRPRLIRHPPAALLRRSSPARMQQHHR